MRTLPLFIGATFLALLMLVAVFLDHDNSASAAFGAGFIVLAVMAVASIKPNP